MKGEKTAPRILLILLVHFFVFPVNPLSLYPAAVLVLYGRLNDLGVAFLYGHPYCTQDVRKASVFVGCVGPGHFVEKIKGVRAGDPIGGEGQGIEIHPPDYGHLFMLPALVDLG